MKYLKTVVLTPDDLDDYPGNAKEHDEVALAESIQSNGQFRSVLARRVGRRIQLLAGHGTTQAIRRSGATDVRVELIEADDDEALNIVLADNEIGRRAGYDKDKLVALLKQADGREVAFTGTGFDAGQYDDLLAELAKAAQTPLEHVDPGTGGETWHTPSLTDLRDRYESKATRTLTFDFTWATFEWLVAQFEVLREARGVESNADLLIRLVEEASGTTAPGPQPDDAAYGEQPGQAPGPGAWE
jgi:hypothetical protein